MFKGRVVVLFRQGLVGVFCFLLSVGGAACAAVDVSECAQIDWERVGYEDGQEGEGTYRLLSHQRICAAVQVVPDSEAWHRGRLRGLGAWCTYANGWRLGQQGKGFDAGMCALQDQAMFLQGMRAGQLDRQQAAETQRRVPLPIDGRPGLTERQKLLFGMVDTLVFSSMFSEGVHEGPLDQSRASRAQHQSNVRRPGSTQEETYPKTMVDVFSHSITGETKSQLELERRRCPALVVQAGATPETRACR